MKKQALRKDFYREIKKAPGRFISLLFIVALGVAFFSGIRASEPDMRLTGDNYFDAANLMDLKAICTYGVTEDDVSALEELDAIEAAEGVKSADLLTMHGDDEEVLHVMSMEEGLNLIEVAEGRLPEKGNECLMDSESGYQIGDVITLYSGNEDPISDTLQETEFRVVGLGSSPCYISFRRGSATVGNGTIDAFMVVEEEAFSLDVYTEVYMTVAGAKDLTAYTDVYDEKIKEAQNEVEDFLPIRATIRKNELINDANKELSDAKKELEEGKAEAEEELADAADQISSAEEELNSGKEKIASGKNKIQSAKNTLSEKQQEIDSGRAEYEAGIEEVEEGKEQLAALLSDIEKDKESLESLNESLAAVNQKIEALGNAAEEESEELTALRTQAQTLEGQITMMTYVVGSKQQAYDDALESLKVSEEELASAKQKLDAGQSQIDESTKTIETQEETLSKSETKIISGEAELEKAKHDYAEGKADAEEEIANGEKKIADAEKEIADIEEPEWYVYDRSTLSENTGYGENADRMRAIGKVFPVLFFLVAALIALTCMTRMVEEQRVAIGTLKALGYKKRDIISKYLNYALLATVLGSVIGVLIGEKILPYIIIHAYGIMYHHISPILVPYNMYYAIIASVISIICTCGATWMACYVSLASQPAALMRPPAPKKGKRVFLEIIPFIWKRLSFTWKSTVRNLFRYKKRLFMTLFGIGGCMGLMIVGYGIKDSVFAVAKLQYAQIQTYDGSLYLNSDLNEEERAKLNDTIAENEEVDRFVSAYMMGSTLLANGTEREAYVTVVKDPDLLPEFVNFRDRKTQEGYEIDDDGVMISEKTAKLLNVSVGDTIEIKDEENGNKEVRISHIFENYMSHYIYMTPTYYQEIYGDEPQYNCVLFACDDSYTDEEVERVGRDLIEADQVLSVSYMHDIQQQLLEMLNSLNLIIIVLIVSAGMLAFVVLYNLNTINITERMRELATLKVLGFHDMEVASYVYRENIVLTFIGSILGIIFGKVLHLFIIETVEVDAAMFGRVIYLPSFIYSFLFTLLFSLLINGVMYFKLKKIDMVESLKSIE